MRARVRHLRQERENERAIAAAEFAAERQLFLDAVQQLSKDKNKPDLHAQEKAD